MRAAGDPGDLALWGLAVALDRLGEHAQALDETKAALDCHDGTTAVLHSPDVFFVPAYEIHWYEALANEALANAAHGRDARIARLQSAKDELEHYLSEGGAGDRWADTARANLERLRTAIASATGNAVRQRR